MESIMYSDYLQDWLAIRSATVRPRTIESYAASVKTIIASVGALPLGALTPAQCAKVYAPYVKAAKHRTAALLYRVMSMSLKDAVLMGMLQASPMAALKMPKYKAKKVKPFTHAEIRAIIKADPAHAFVWNFLWMTGARRGEACALRWSDVDFTRKELTIQRQIVRADGILTETEPKSDTGIRTIPMDTTMVKLFRDQLRLQLMHGRQGDRVLSNNGTTIDPRQLNKWLTQAATAAGVEDAHPHRFRHTFGADGVSAGVEMRVLQELMGHSDISVTARYYTAVREDAKREATDQLNTYRTGTE